MFAVVSRSLRGRSRHLQIGQLIPNHGSFCRAAHGSSPVSLATGGWQETFPLLRSGRQSGSLNRRRLLAAVCAASVAAGMPFKSATACATKGNSAGSLYGRVLPAFLGRR